MEGREESTAGRARRRGGGRGTEEGTTFSGVSGGESKKAEAVLAGTLSYQLHSTVQGRGHNVLIFLTNFNAKLGNAEKILSLRKSNGHLTDVSVEFSA